MARILGIDYGQQRLGFAVGEEVIGIALPLDTATATGPRQAVAESARRARAQQAGAVVVGLPLNMNGTRGPAAAAAADFAARLRAELSLPVVTWDERLTTRAAERALIAADVRRARRRAVLDQAAAQIMLQSYLDAHNGGAAPGPEIKSPSHEA